ncbi:MAG: TolC family protein, partial [Muribaculaceae bacterium]|nr:TolC family protein [Muribaculaceae bacterium]
MRKLRLLAGLLCAVLQVGAGSMYAQEITSIEELFEYAETHSAQLRPFITAQTEADKGIDEALTKRLPDISAAMSFSYIGDGFTTRRNLSDYEKAPIPHLGTGLSIDINQPVYTGGAISGSIELAKLNSNAARLRADLRRDNLRMQITGFYLDIYKCNNLRQVVESNITSARKILADMQARYDQGTVLQNDITRYELLIANLDLQLTKINNTLEILNNNLVTVTGLPENTRIKADSMLLNRSLPVNGENWWQQECISHSPSLKLARVGIDISRKAEDIVKSDRLPKIGLQARWTMD